MKKILTFFAFIAIAIIFLEFLSTKVKCPPRAQYDQAFLDSMPLDKGKQEFLSDLKRKRETGQKISKEKYRAAFEKLVIEVEPKRLGSFYGLAFVDGRAFVRNDLPNSIKIVVRRHELEHLLQTGKEFNKEFLANFATFKEYPWDGLKMVWFAIQDKFNSTDSILCTINNLWATFKVYLLPLKK